MLLPTTRRRTPFPIRFGRNDKGTGTEMLPVIVSRIVPGDPPVSYWPNFFFPSLETSPEDFAKVNWAQFPPFYSCEFSENVFYDFSAFEEIQVYRGY